MDLLLAALAVSSVLLLVVNFRGRHILTGRQQRGDCGCGEPRTPPLPRSLRSFIVSVKGEADQGEEAFFIALCDRLTARFVHGPGQFSLWSNWLAWILSPWIGRLRMIENTGCLFRYSEQAFCHQIAQAMVDIATRLGQKARVVSLNGHVVAEAFFDGGWHGFDPDYGVVFRHGGRILSVEELAGAPQVAAEVYREHRFDGDNEEVLQILRRGQLTCIEPGGHLSPKTAAMQRILSFCKWAIPLAGLATAASLKWTIAA